MKCQVCGTDNVETQFCIECGSNLKINDSEPVESDDSGINKEFIDQFKTLSTRINELSGVEETFQQQQLYYNNVSREYENAKRKFSETQFVTANEQRDVDRLNKFTWTSIKARIRGKREALLEIEEAELIDALNKQEAARHDLEQLKRKSDIASEQFDQANLQFVLLQQLIDERSRVVHQACHGVADPVEDRVEEELDVLTKRRVPILNRKQRLTVTRDHLLAAQRHFQNASGLLQSAMKAADWDTFWGGGFMADSMKHSKMADARNAVQTGYRSLQMAYQMFPELPQIPHVQLSQGSYFWDVAFDNFFSDMRARDQIQNSIYTVNNLHMQLQLPMQHVSTALAQVDQEDVSIYNEISTKQQELSRERMRMMEEAV